MSVSLTHSDPFGGGKGCVFPLKLLYRLSIMKGCSELNDGCISITDSIQDKKAKKKATKLVKSKGGKSASGETIETASTDKSQQPAVSPPVTTSASVPNTSGSLQKRNLTPRVEEVEEGDSE